jgi:hypothetical protein
MDIINKMQNIHPIKLTWFQESHCQICKKQSNELYTIYINKLCYFPNSKYGYVLCENSLCYDIVIKYIKYLLYNSYTKEILNLYANQYYINVKRSNGTIENDWQLNTYDQKLIPLYKSFCTAILCSGLNKNEKDKKNKNEKDKNNKNEKDKKNKNEKDKKNKNEKDKKNKNNNFELTLPQEIWEYIYNICLETYKEQLPLLLEYNYERNKMDSFISINKNDLCKMIRIDEL